MPDGFWHGLSAYFLWGMLPLYFGLIRDVAPTEVVAQRIVWSLLLVFVLLAITGSLRRFTIVLRTPRALLAMTGSAIMICLNWLVYIWAISNGHIVASSLGYFLNPLVNVLLGFLFLGERLRRNQMIAVGFAAAGVMILSASAMGSLWISLALAFSFAFYGLIRRLSPVAPLEGLAVETLVLSPFAAGYLVWLTMTGTIAFGQNSLSTVMLMLSGAITAIPLLLYAMAAKRMSYSTLGLMQYVAPTLQLALGVLVFHEPLSTTQLVSFGFIWTGLALFTLDSLRVAHGNRALASVPEAG